MSDIKQRLLKRQHVTIKEVAERAGVSQMTVSRVLNQRDIVREATRNRVDKAIEELNYRPNPLARSLAGGSALFIGLVYSNPSRNYLSELIIGAMQRCRKQGHHLVLEEFEDSEDNTDVVVERIRSAGLDVAIVAPPLSENAELIERLKKQQVPTVLIAPREQSDSELNVSIDDEDAACRMMEYLHDAGHSQIGFIRGPEDHASARRRYRGYLAGLDQFDLATNKAWIEQGDYTYRSGMDAATAILSGKKRPTAIFAANDDMAAGAMAAAMQLGLHVPDDISIVGFDDSPIASAIWPQLTTVRQPIADMSGQAIELIASCMERKSDQQLNGAVMLDVSIIARDSVRPLQG